MLLKKLILPAGILMLGLFLGACKKDSSANGNNQTPAAGTWVVSYFFDDKDETSNYTGYSFEFGANGSLTVKNGAQTYSGTWSTGTDDSTEKFVINFSGSIPSELSDLAEDWHIVSFEDNLLHFEDSSGGNGNTDVLKFSK